MILVTGGAGYIGSNLALRLLELGHNIVIFDNLSTGHIEIINKLKNLDLKGKIVDFIKGDLKNLQEIESALSKYKFEAIFHFAAFSIVSESAKNPSIYWENNFLGTKNLLDAMKKFNINKIVFSSTAATYGEPNYVPIDEKHPQRPINAYGNTKLALEFLMDDYSKAYGIRSARLRYFNVIGADKFQRTGEWHETETHLVPNILKSLNTKGKTFNIFGNTYNTKDGTCVRDYIVMDDLINAHIKALEYLNNGGKTDFFNLGTKEGNSVLEVIQTAEEVTGQKISYEIKEKREGDPAILIADNKKAKEILNWQPEKTLKEGIESAYNWEKANFYK